MRRGVRLAVDVGSVRVGVARCDPDGMLAVPECTLARAADSDVPATDIDQLARLVEEYQAVEVLIGLPLTLAGAEGPAAAAARGYAEAVARRVAPVGVRLAHGISKRALQVSFAIFLYIVVARFLIDLMR